MNPDLCVEVRLAYSLPKEVTVFITNTHILPAQLTS